MRRCHIRRRRRGQRGASGRRSLSPKGWDSLKRWIIETRASWRCEAPDCLRKLVLDVHHIVKRSAGGEDSKRNCVALCRACHDDTDRPLTDRKRLEILPGEALIGDAFQMIFIRGGSLADVARCTWHGRPWFE